MFHRSQLAARLCHASFLQVLANVGSSARDYVRLSNVWQTHYGEAIAYLAEGRDSRPAHMVLCFQDSCVYVSESRSTRLGLWLNWVATQPVCSAAAPTTPGVSTQPLLSSCMTLASHLSSLWPLGSSSEKRECTYLYLLLFHCYTSHCAQH